MHPEKLYQRQRQMQPWVQKKHFLNLHPIKKTHKSRYKIPGPTHSPGSLSNAMGSTNCVSKRKPKPNFFSKFPQHRVFPNNSGWVRRCQQLHLYTILHLVSGSEEPLNSLIDWLTTCPIYVFHTLNDTIFFCVVNATCVDVVNLLAAWDAITFVDVSCVHGTVHINANNMKPWGMQLLHFTWNDVFLQTLRIIFAVHPPIEMCWIWFPCFRVQTLACILLELLSLVKIAIFFLVTALSLIGTCFLCL